MTSTKPLPEHLIDQIHDGKGQSYKDAITFDPHDFLHYVDLEYVLIRNIANKQQFQYKIIDQTLLFARSLHVYDIIQIKRKDGKVIKFYFDITHVFGLDFLNQGIPV
jgi:hypothetical protein